MKVQLGQNTFTDNYADDITLMGGTQNRSSIALVNMKEKASKLGLFWIRIKVENLGSGLDATKVSMNGHANSTVKDWVVCSLVSAAPGLSILSAQKKTLNFLVLYSLS